MKVLDTTAPSQPQRYLIDALNLAHWCGRPPSLRLPLALLTRLLASQQPAVLCFDASASHQLQAEAEVYTQLLHHPAHCIEVPTGRTADGVLLRQARAQAACIVSRDHFADHRRRYRKLIDTPGRVLPGWVKDDLLQVPGLVSDVPVAATALLAWQQLHPLLS